MKKVFYLFVLILCSFVYLPSFSQGCVAIRSSGASCNMPMTELDSSVSKEWQFFTSYRYFKSFRHFKGKVEQIERLEKHTEVINWSHSLDLTLQRQFNNRWSASIGLPILYNERSSLYEHGLKERHSTTSKGIGDLRIIASRWMFNPHKSPKFNIQLGIGIKLPTGNYKYTDQFQNVGPDGTAQTRPVDQSIQLGDGGVGAIVTMNTYLQLNKHFSTYANLYYLLNPRDQNGTRTYLETLNPKFNDDRYYMSVPDQYLIRGGINYSFHNQLQGLSLGAGVRMEGLPAEDLLGGSSGWRRPGYVLSIEPGVSYSHNKLTLFANVPVALERNRVQSVQDKKESITTGTKVIGDAAFADYSINIGAVFRFN